MDERDNMIALSVKLPQGIWDHQLVHRSWVGISLIEPVTCNKMRVYFSLSLLFWRNLKKKPNGSHDVSCVVKILIQQVTLA